MEAVWILCATSIAFRMWSDHKAQWECARPHDLIRALGADTRTCREIELEHWNRGPR